MAGKVKIGHKDGVQSYFEGRARHLHIDNTNKWNGGPGRQWQGESNEQCKTKRDAC